MRHSHAKKVAKLGVQVTRSDIFGTWGSAWQDELALPQN
jgi:hypothetical protein